VNRPFDSHYYLARCTGDEQEQREAGEFHSQGRPSDRDIVVRELRRHNLAEFARRISAGEDASGTLWDGDLGRMVVDAIALAEGGAA